MSPWPLTGQPAGRTIPPGLRLVQRRRREVAMPFHIIVTISNTVNSEVYQSATALVHKFSRERSIWYHATREMGGGWTCTLLMAPGDPLTLAKRIAEGVIRFDG